MFVFGGRRANMELQMPFVHRILAEHPDVVFHIWNLARNKADHDYLQTLAADRIEVISTHYGDPEPWLRFNDIYTHYAAPRYQGATFVKLDDDVVFIETERFDEFINAVHSTRPGEIVSAKVVNNGACVSTEAGLQKVYDRIHAATLLPLLDVHLSAEFALASHRHFLEYWESMLNQAPGLIPTHDWLSINFIGYSWETGTRISRLLGARSPREVAGRRFPRGARTGDEGVCNMLGRYIFQGLTVAHLTFGPQEPELKKSDLADIRKQYATLGAKYLESSRV